MFILKVWDSCRKLLRSRPMTFEIHTFELRNVLFPLGFSFDLKTQLHAEVVLSN